MKATLEYDLPDEQDEFEKAVNGGKYAYIIWELDHFLRAKTKYAPDSMPDEVHKAYEGYKRQAAFATNRKRLINMREQFMRIAMARLRRAYPFKPQRRAVAAKMWTEHLERYAMREWMRTEQELNNRMDIIGQNGNTGEHYEKG
jgi:hypothetical protein